MRNKICYVNGCFNSILSIPKRNFFQIPRKRANSTLCEQWVLFTQNATINLESKRPFGYICDAHFSDGDFQDEARQILCKSVVPSLLSPTEKVYSSSVSSPSSPGTTPDQSTSSMHLVPGMEISFANKRVLVTGAGKGIGRDLCKKLVKCGAHVVAISRTKATLDSLVAETPGIEAVCLDLADDWYKTRSVLEQIGPVDCLVNNAAVAICTPFLDTPPEEFDTLFNINVKAVLNVSQVVAKGMIKQGKGGSIVNISSQASQAALKDHIVYCGTKGALDIMSKVMALELGPHNIRVNCVNPTVVMTDMGRVGWSDPKKAGEMLSKIPLNRFAEVDEVVNAILFLLSDVAPIVNGVTLPVDGGFLAC